MHLWDIIERLSDSPGPTVVLERRKIPNGDPLPNSGHWVRTINAMSEDEVDYLMKEHKVNLKAKC